METLDLSTTGAACASPIDLPLQTQVGVWLRLPPRASDPPGTAGRNIECEGVVVNVERVGRGGGEWRAGLFFLQMKGEDQEALRRFIFEIIQNEEDAMSERGRSGSMIPAVMCAMAAAIALSAPALAYTLLTRDGHRIEAKARPEIRGANVFVRLSPGGQLAVIPGDQIDWDATGKANPAPQTIAIPADAKLAIAAPEPAPVRIKGGGRKEVAAPVDETAPLVKGGSTEVVAQEGLIKLQKEYAFLQTQRDAAAARRLAHQEELAQIEAGSAIPAGSDNSAAKRLRTLKDQISEESGQIDRLEIRMNDIRVQAVGLGGAID